MVDDYRAVHAQTLEEAKREDRRPWGYFEVLSERGGHKVKRMVVYPGKRLSLQRHRRRTEHWVVVSGFALVTLEDREIALGPGQSIDVPLGAKHRIANVGVEHVVFIEVQMGDYFGEDDIERFEDDFGRAG